LGSKVKVPRRSLRYATHRLMFMHTHSKYPWPISKEKNVMARTRKCYLKNNYLTLRSKVKDPRRSLWYATDRLMVMHPHTKYNWPIWKDKKVMVRTSFTEKKQKKQKRKRKKKIRLKQYVSLHSKVRHNYHRLENYNNFWLAKAPGINKLIFLGVARPYYRV
jgi:hypothetical protein